MTDFMVTAAQAQTGKNCHASVSVPRRPAAPAGKRASANRATATTPSTQNSAAKLTRCDGVGRRFGWMCTEHGACCVPLRCHEIFRWPELISEKKMERSPVLHKKQKSASPLKFSSVPTHHTHLAPRPPCTDNSRLRSDHQSNRHHGPVLEQVVGAHVRQAGAWGAVAAHLAALCAFPPPRSRSRAHILRHARAGCRLRTCPGDAHPDGRSRCRWYVQACVRRRVPWQRSLCSRPHLRACQARPRSCTS